MKNTLGLKAILEKQFLWHVFSDAYVYVFTNMLTFDFDSIEREKKTESKKTENKKTNSIKESDKVILPYFGILWCFLFF